MQVHADLHACDAILHGIVERADFCGSRLAHRVGQRYRAHADVLQPLQRLFDQFRPPGLAVGVAKGHRNVHHQIAPLGFRLVAIVDQLARFARDMLALARRKYAEIEYG